MEETASSTTNNSYNKRPMWQWVVLYLLIAVVLYGAFYYVFLAKKGGYNSGTTQTPAYTSPTQSASETSAPAAVSNEMIVTLNAVNNSAESGTATLAEADGKTTVTVDLTGFTKDVSQPAHIHVGNCPGVGAVKYPLTNLVNGKSVTVIAATLDDLKSQLPLAINIHKSAAEITNYTACGELPSQ